jgi:CubicO group peptidase (beta-lactamase class C family)
MTPVLAIRTLFLVFVSSVLPSLGIADDLDLQIRSLMAKQTVPALALAIVRHKKIVRLGAYGFANLEWKAKATNDTRFEIASISKMFCGAAVRVLIEQGKLDVEDSVSRYIPGTPASWAGMKLRHLLTMSSGLPEDFGFDTIPYGAEVLGPHDDNEMLRQFFDLKMAAPVGQEFHYSGPNFALLGMIVAKVSGVSYRQFVRDHLFKPAGMTQTTLIDNSAIVPQRAEGYRMQNGVPKRGWFLGQYLHSRPDVAVLTTARDLAKWVIALEQHKILKHPEKLWEGAVSDSRRWLDYSYGWTIESLLGHRRLDHSGGFRTGFHTWLCRYPDDDLTVIVLTNCDYSGVREFELLATRRYLRLPYDPAIESKKIDREPAKTARLVIAMKGAAGGKLDARMFAPNAFDPVGLDEASGFLKPVDRWSFAGRTHLQGAGLKVHGKTFKECETLKLQVGSQVFFLTLYLDSSGRIGYLEPTT